MWIAIVIAGVLFAADQLLRKLSRQGKLPSSLLRGHIRLQTLENSGLLGGWDNIRQPLLTILPCAGWLGTLVSLLPDFRKKSTAEQIGASLIIAGGAGNAAERLLRGKVTDYIRFPHLPGKLRALVWNIADFMLLAGAVWLAIGSILKRCLKK